MKGDDWKFFKEFVAEDCNEHGGIWTQFAVAIILVILYTIYLLVTCR